MGVGTGGGTSYIIRKAIVDYLDLGYARWPIKSILLTISTTTESLLHLYPSDSMFTLNVFHRKHTHALHEQA